MNKKRATKRWIAFFLPLLLSCLCLNGCKEESKLVPEKEVLAQGYKRIDFEYYSLDKTEAFDYFYYTDDFFKVPASEVDLPFAHASYAWAMSNFPYDWNEKNDYSNKSRNAKETASKMGFIDFEANEYFKMKPMTTSIGLTCSRKELEIEGKKVTILLLGVRGACYTAEWVSNFTMGEEGLHEGFASAAKIAISFLNQYIDSRHIEGNIKLWVSGFSRAAATTNLIAGMIDEGIRDGESLLLEQVQYGKDDVYAACFEPPQGALVQEGVDLQGEDFNNIKCFLNPHDFVTLVAPSVFYFSRYGVQNYYPSSTRTLEYETYEKKMLYFLDQFIKNGHPNYKPYQISLFSPQAGASETGGTYFGKDARKVNWQVEMEVRDLIDELCYWGLHDRENFARNVQPGLAETIGMVFGKASDEEAGFMDVMKQLIPDLMDLNLLKPLLDDLMIEQLHSYFASDFNPFLVRAFHRTMPDLADEEIEKIAVGLSGLVTGIAKVAFSDPGVIASLVSMNNISAITYSHYHEINYFWLKAMNPLIYKEPVPTTFDLTWQKLTFGDVKDIEVFDSTGASVVKFVQGKPIEVDSRYSFGIKHLTYEDRSVIFLPSKHAYTVVAKNPTPKVDPYLVHSYFESQSSLEKQIEYAVLEIPEGGSFTYQVKPL